MTQINREHKDRVFRLIFADESNKKNALSLYNALNNSSYQNEEELELTTIKEAIYITMKNDLSFIIADTMNLDENDLSPHVSTIVKIPTPNYIVFYNGITKRPAMEKLRLSSAFQVPDDRGEFEWTATVINLNHEDNKDLLQRCKPLSDYTTLISKIQTYQQTMSVTEAINRAVDECIAENVLADFLKAHRAEVLDLYLAEINEEVLRKNLKAEGFQEGRDNLLTEQITKKIKAGKPLEQIAEEVELSVEEIQNLYETIQNELLLQA